MPARRPRNVDAFLDKVEEWVEASKGRIHADKAHEKLLALGFTGSDRSTRRAVGEVKKAFRLGHAPVPDEPHTVVFGLARRVPPNTPMVTFEHGQYSVPAHLLGEQVWVRTHGTGTGEQVIVVHHSHQGPVEVARHLRATPGSPQIRDDHFGGPTLKQPGEYVVRPRNDAEREFLAIGDGTRVWLGEAAAAGTQKIPAKMDAAVTMAKVAGTPGSTGHSAMPQ